MKKTTILNDVPIAVDYTSLGSVFTLAKASATYNGRLYTGEGVARRSKLDPPDNGKGIAIATGRAIKALHMKITKRPIHSNNVFMG